MVGFRGKLSKEERMTALKASISHTKILSNSFVENTNSNAEPVPVHFTKECKESFFEKDEAPVRQITTS